MQLFPFIYSLYLQIFQLITPFLFTALAPISSYRLHIKRLRPSRVSLFNWSAMTTKTGKKMKSFMCHSTSATAVCTVSDSRTVIVPRKSDRNSTTMLDNPSSSRLKMMTTVKYSRLVDSPGLLPSNTNRSSSSIKKRESKNQANYTPKLPLHSSSSDQVFQVVVMRVSLHCQGCAGKVKKHLSKMEGVTSFSIDLETQRVTVMGHISPVGVLESISKVKRAEFWPCS